MISKSESNLITILFVLISALLAFANLSIFMTVDDFAIMLDFVQGFEAPFIHTGLSLVFANLYKVDNSIPWYGITLLALQIYICENILRGTLKLSKSNNFLFKIVLFSFCLLITLQLSYNNLATYCALASFLNFIDNNNKLTKENLFIVLIGIIFRVELFVLSYILLSIIGLSLIDKFKDLLKWIAFGASITVITSIISILLLQAVSAPEFREFQKFNFKRGFIHDFPVLEEVIENQEYTKLGWTADHAYFFSHWYYPDENKYNSKTLDLLKKNNEQKNVERSWISHIDLNKVIHSNWIFNIFIIIFFYSLLIGQTKMNGLITFLSFAYLTFIVCFLRAPPRMTVPFSMNLILLFGLAQKSSSLLKKFFISALFVALVSTRVFNFYTDSLQTAKKQNETLEYFNNLNLDSNNTNMAFHFIGKHSSFPFQDYRQFSELAYFNWSFFTPRYYKSLKFASFKDLKEAMTKDCHIVDFYLDALHLGTYNRAMKTFFGNGYKYEILQRDKFIIARTSASRCFAESP